jgi:hypothetical protein
MMRRVSIIAAMGVVGYLAVLPSTGSVAATGPVSFHLTTGHVTRLAMSARGVAGLPRVRQDRTAARALTFRSPLGHNRPTQAGRKTPGTGAQQLSRAWHGRNAVRRPFQRPFAFNGLSNQDSFRLNGFPDTPPDQGLCVGRDGSLRGGPEAVWEPINSAARETSVTGRLLRPDVSLATLFHDPFNLGDVRCLYDPGTRSFYFTEIGYPVQTGPASDGNNTTVDVVVMNARGVASYQFDTSLGGSCFGDQPKTGFDNNALVISTDEFCGPTESSYEGAIVLAISKSQLARLAYRVNDAVLGPVSLAGLPVTGLDPAIGTGTSTEYLVNSFPFQLNGDNNPAANTLGLWTLRNDASITTGHGSPVLIGRLIRSQQYAFPVPAASTGDGSTHVYKGMVITSEAYLNPDDSRISGPVNVTWTRGGIRLWTALDSAVRPRGDSADRDGAAWFEIDPGRQRVTSQGYVATSGAYLLYPAVLAPRFGRPAMVFTVTSQHINPAAAFTTLGSRFIGLVAQGAGPHESFSDAPPFNQARWGDYSFAAADPNGRGIWLATEYIPPTRYQNGFDNWGTYVFEVPGLLGHH